MKDSDVDRLQQEASRVNELRREFWERYRALRNEFLAHFPVDKYSEDPDWQGINDLIHDMSRSLIEEDIRRQFHPPPRYRPQNNELNENECIKLHSAYIDAEKRLKRFLHGNPEIKKSGLYSSNKLCMVCGKPLAGALVQFKYI